MPTTDELQAEVESARAALEQAVADLKAGVAPQAIAERGVDAVKGWFTDEHGGLRPDRLAIVGGAVVGLIALRLIAGRRR
jgi:hypothetical protein